MDQEQNSRGAQLKKICPMGGGHPFVHIPLLPVLVCLCPRPSDFLFFIPFLLSPVICIRHKSFKGKPIPSAYPRGPPCNTPTSLPVQFGDSELVSVFMKRERLGIKAIGDSWLYKITWGCCGAEPWVDFYTLK